MGVTLDGIRDIKLYQNKDGYRFSIDALLLSSFVRVKFARDIVDLGAGSGVIGLLLARKYQASSVVLIELQKSLYHLAQRNVTLNGLQERVSVLLTDINDTRSAVKPLSFDVAVSNPPFRKAASGRISEGKEKAVARHEIMLKLPDLVAAASYLLKSRGRFFLIYHPERLLEVVDVLRYNRLEPKKARFVHSSRSSESKIVLIEAVKEGRSGLKIEKPLFIYGDDGGYSEEVKVMYDPGGQADEETI